MTSNYIVIKIDQTCDVLGGYDLLKQKGFYHVIDYVNIVKKINELSFDNVLNVLRNLILDGNIYKEFALHLIDGGMLHDKFFELDEYFNPTKNNLNQQLKSELNLEYDDMSYSSELKNNAEGFMKEEMDIIKKDYQKLYESTIKNNTSSTSINKSLYLNKIKEITSNTTEEHLDWISKNIIEMTDADYGTFMVTLSKVRESN